MSESNKTNRLAHRGVEIPGSMINAAYLTVARWCQSPVEKTPLVKAIAVAFFCALTVSMRSSLGPVGTFLVLDLVLIVYMVTRFHSEFRYLFLIHPIFVLISSYGFQVPYTEIGVGYTYLDSFAEYVDPSTSAVDIGLLVQQMLFAQGDLSFKGIYTGTIPILWLPHFLFDNAPDITVYLSLSVFTVLYAAIAVSVAMHHDVMREEVLLVIALISTVSPTFLWMNSSLHRYGLLFLGLFLFLVAYMGLLSLVSGLRTISLLVTMLLAVMLVTASKAPLLMSLVLFVLLERFSRNRLYFISKWFSRFDKKSKSAFIVIGIAVAQYFSTFIVPEKYALIYSQQGGEYSELINLPILGLALRLAYAVLSPFPWINFSQWELYGDNTIFLWVHIFSVLVSVWVIISFFSCTRRIVTGADDIRICSLFGIAIMSSLAFSAIGYHAYWAPALPFLATILIEKSNRISFIYPIGFVLLMEVVAQVARVIR